MRFPISVSLQPCLYLAWLTIYHHLFPKLERGHARDSEHIPFGVIYHACAITPVYQSANEIWSTYLHQFQRYDWGKIKKTGHMTMTTPIRGQSVIRRLALNIIYLHTKFGNYLFSHSWDMIVGIEIENRSCDPDHALVRGGLLPVRASIWYSLLVYKI